MTDKTELEVTQADREAAADAVKAYRDSKNNDWQGRIRRGECDDGEMVQTFARHRLATRAPDPTPVAWMYDYGYTKFALFTRTKPPAFVTETPLYAHPPAAPADGLVEALERIATVDHGGGFLGAQACRKIATTALAAHRGEA